MKIRINNLPYTVVRHSLVDPAAIFLVAHAAVIHYLKMNQGALFQLLLVVIFSGLYYNQWRVSIREDTKHLSFRILLLVHTEEFETFCCSTDTTLCSKFLNLCTKLRLI